MQGKLHVSEFSTRSTFAAPLVSTVVAERLSVEETCTEAEFPTGSSLSRLTPIPKVVVFAIVIVAGVVLNVTGPPIEDADCSVTISVSGSSSAMSVFVWISIVPLELPDPIVNVVLLGAS